MLLGPGVEELEVEVRAAAISMIVIGKREHRESGGGLVGREERLSEQSRGGKSELFGI
jgi:hypothetical protein